MGSTPLLPWLQRGLGVAPTSFGAAEPDSPRLELHRVDVGEIPSGVNFCAFYPGILRCTMHK